MRKPASARAARFCAFPCPKGWPRVGGPDGDRHREERHERSSQVRARVRRLGEQPEAPAREPRDELDRDQEAGGPDRDERGAALRRHARKATASAGRRVERPAVGNALQLVLAALLEHDSRPGHDIATVRVTSTSPGSASAETRAPMWTAIPAHPVPRAESLRRRAAHIERRDPAAGSRPERGMRSEQHAPGHRTSPVPRHRQRRRDLHHRGRGIPRTVDSNRSRITLQRWSPSSLSCSVERATSTATKTVARTRSTSSA